MLARLPVTASSSHLILFLPVEGNRNSGGGGGWVQKCPLQGPWTETPGPPCLEYVDLIHLFSSVRVQSQPETPENLWVAEDRTHRRRHIYARAHLSGASRRKSPAFCLCSELACALRWSTWELLTSLPYEESPGPGYRITAVPGLCAPPPPALSPWAPAFARRVLPAAQGLMSCLRSITPLCPALETGHLMQVSRPQTGRATACSHCLCAPWPSPPGS